MNYKLLTVFAVVISVAEVYSRRHCRCYDIFTFRRNRDTWQSARDHCLMLGGDLAKIDDFTENQYLSSLLETENRKRQQDGWYIGGKMENGEWVWADGSPMTFSNFPPADATVTAARNVVTYAGIFYDFGAYNWGYLSPRARNKMGYICEFNNC